MSEKSNSKATLVTNPFNIRYLTGFTTPTPHERSAYLLITNDAWHLIVPPLYESEANAIQKAHSHIHVCLLTPENPLIKILSLYQTAYSSLEVEATSLTYKEYQDIQSALPHVRIVPSNGWIETKRAKKTQEEIRWIAEAARRTDECFAFLQTNIREGMSEADIAWMIERYIREHDGQIAFPPIVAFNDHSALPHYMPQHTTRLVKNSLVLLDFGAVIHGYHADMTRIIFFGTPKDEWIRVHDIVQRAHDEAETSLTHHNAGSEADKRAKEVISNAGYPPYPHSLGHGVGLEIHEQPRLSSYKDETIEDGMVFTIEPAIYLPNTFGIRIEDLYLKTASGLQKLSQSPYVTILS